MKTETHVVEERYVSYGRGGVGNLRRPSDTLGSPAYADKDDVDEAHNHNHHHRRRSSILSKFSHGGDSVHSEGNNLNATENVPSSSEAEGEGEGEKLASIWKSATSVFRHGASSSAIEDDDDLENAVEKSTREM